MVHEFKNTRDRIAIKCLEAEKEMEEAFNLVNDSGKVSCSILTSAR